MGFQWTLVNSNAPLVHLWDLDARTNVCLLDLGVTLKCLVPWQHDLRIEFSISATSYICRMPWVVRVVPPRDQLTMPALLGTIQL